MESEILRSRRKDELLAIAAKRKLDHRPILERAGSNELVQIGLLATALGIDVRIALNLRHPMEGVALQEGGG